MTHIIRIATTDDSASIDVVLKASYPELLAGHYPADLLAQALPLMTSANPRLLTSGTYYMAEVSGGVLAGCGGWTHERPGTGEREAGLGHVRHFAVHPDLVGRGVGRALFERCIADAKLEGVTRFECYSTLAAEGFYRALGFETVRPFDVDMGSGTRFPSLLMSRDIG